jgi:serine/threonine protein kinase
MTPDHWRLVNDLFHAALACDTAERDAFLEQSCADPSVKAEVSSLLMHADDAPSGFTPPEPTVSGVAPGATPIEPDLVGSRLGHYDILSVLGSGGMGVVYLANDRRLGRPVAIKALSPRYLSDDHCRRRLRQEARAAATLSHPAIATVYALEEFDGALYLVCEYVPGTTLREALQDGPLPTATVLQAGTDIASALAAAHARDLVHRDLKPENVMLTPEGSVKILDFGLAQFRHPPAGVSMSDTRLTRPGAVIGTPGYMAPEQLRGADPDFRADLFAFGVTLYELATGRHPFVGDDPVTTLVRVLEAEPAPSDALEACPPGFQQVVSRCLEKDPQARFDDTTDLVRALEAATPEPPSHASGTRPISWSPLWWWQLHQIFVSVLLYALLIPLWVVRGWTPGSIGNALFFGALAASAVGATLRLHLWFTSRVYPSELLTQRHKTARWVRGADWTFALVLLGAAAATLSQTAVSATLLVGTAIATLVASLVIEPATTRAAFPHTDAP